MEMGQFGQHPSPKAQILINHGSLNIIRVRFLEKKGSSDISLALAARGSSADSRIEFGNLFKRRAANHRAMAQSRKYLGLQHLTDNPIGDLGMLKFLQ